MSQAVAQLKDIVNGIQQGGGQKAIERHLSRGKLLPRERIDKLLDAGYGAIIFIGQIDQICLCKCFISSRLPVSDIKTFAHAYYSGPLKVAIPGAVTTGWIPVVRGRGSASRRTDHRYWSSVWVCYVDKSPDPVGWI